MRAADVIDGLRDLTTRASSSPAFQTVIGRSTCLDMGWTDKTLASKMLASGGVDCYQVTKDMVPLVQMAAESLDETDAFRIDFAPGPAGLVQFEHPIEVVDIRERIMHVSWIRWGVAQGNRCWAIAFADSSQPDEVNLELHEKVDPELLAALGRWRYTGVSVVRDGALLTLMDADTRAHSRAVKDGLVQRDPSRERSHDEQLARVLKALWLLMGQKVGETSTQHLDRASAKRAKRLSLPTSVTVVELRQPRGVKAKGEESGGSVDWSVRWMVRGTFQWRQCSEQHPFAERYEKGFRARVWVGPYAKNADRDDLPWKQGDKVYQLKR